MTDFADGEHLEHSPSLHPIRNRDWGGGGMSSPENIFLVSEFIYMNDENLKEKSHLPPGKLEDTVNTTYPLDINF